LNKEANLIAFIAPELSEPVAGAKNVGIIRCGAEEGEVGLSQPDSKELISIVSQETNSDLIFIKRSTSDISFDLISAMYHYMMHLNLHHLKSPFVKKLSIPRQTFPRPPTI
jgi:hypothetical protein